tara:strand:+ start:1984 stop:2088 length:105 start_codon:yes stop_codon:yes gene_type:complete
MNICPSWSTQRLNEAGSIAALLGAMAIYLVIKLR